jgi:predicted nucleotidyltransferase
MLLGEAMARLQYLPVDESQLDQFCRRWKIARLELFGSALHGLDRARDVDLLVTFCSDAEWGLFDHVHIENELSALLGRKVDLVSRRAIEASSNVIRRSAILGSAVPVYVAG